MPRERRAYSYLPEYYRTPQNNRDAFISDDVLFEPEAAEFLSGYIGTPDPLSADDLERSPMLREIGLERQKYQLSIGVASTDPDTGAYLSGGFYTDLVNHISVNGGFTEDHNRLFASVYYAWTPPIDYDKHVNFSRYFWTAPGAADANGEFVTKEAAGSLSTAYLFDGESLTEKTIRIVNGLPAIEEAGTLVEDASTTNRLVYLSNGNNWTVINLKVFASLPTRFDRLLLNEYLYICRSGPHFNRPIFWMYSEQAGRWLSQPAVVSTEEPDLPREGMIWENAKVTPYRRFQRYTNRSWVPLVYRVAAGPSGIGNDGEYIYDIRNLADITDGWSANNWWRHHEDLAPSDRAVLREEDQATRPILEFWAGIDHVALDYRSHRNKTPKYRRYAYHVPSGEIKYMTIENFPELDANSTSDTPIFQYKIGSGSDDPVLGFPLVYNETGEFVFEFSLQTDVNTVNGTPVPGYYYFKDAITGYIHALWSKSTRTLQAAVDADGLYELPKSLTSNGNHAMLIECSRSQILPHMSGVIKGQDEFSGVVLGLNSFRWTKKDPTVGATLIDPEHGLVRAIALLQHKNFDLADTIRQTAKEYNRVLFKFQNKLNLFWDELKMNSPTGVLTITPSQAVDVVLSEIFIGRNRDFPYFYSDMGTFIQSDLNDGSVLITNTVPVPIFIPPSPTRIGTTPSYRPSKFRDRDGTVRLRGHDGRTVLSYGDDRDLVWLDLENRFHAKVQAQYKTETVLKSSRYFSANFFLDDYYGNYIPTTSIEPVDQVVDDISTTTPSANLRVFSKGQGLFAVYDGYKWLTSIALVDDIFKNLDDNEYYIFNGKGTYQIQRWNHPFTFAYSYDEFRRVIRREFERWAASQHLEFVDNTTFSETDPFTWNYRSAGVEGHYLGIYGRIYGTIRPHSHPWEIAGYAIEPDWWRTEYVPDGVADDGTPRYVRRHQMWIDLGMGIVNQISGKVRLDRMMIAPIPVSDSGSLLDPIAAGIVDVDVLDAERINDAWTFGDGAPSEQLFYESPYWSFTYALASYLMKPGIFVDRSWSLRYISIGDIGENKIWHGPHIIHVETLDRPRPQAALLHLEQNVVTPSGARVHRLVGGIVENLGLNAWIAERVQINGGNGPSFGLTIRNTTPTLAWKCAGFINAKRTVIRTLAGKEIPFEDIHPILHESVPYAERFCSGLMVLREGTGYRIFGFDPFKPFFRVEVPAIPLVGGQVELREEIVATVNQHVFTTTSFNVPLGNDTAKLRVLVDGLRLKPQHIKAIDKNTFEIEDIIVIHGGETVVPTMMTVQSNPSTRMKKFTIEGVDFPYFAKGSGIYQEIEYGRYFDTATDVINFMLGYGRALEADGWVFDVESTNTGTIQDWLGGAKNFAAWVMQTTSPWVRSPAEDLPAFFFSPITRQAKFITEFGQIGSIESIQNGVYGILNDRAEPINIEDTTISRVGDTLIVSATGRDSIYGLRVYLSRIQHVVFFTNITKFNDLIYDPTIALWHKTMRIDGYRTKNWNGRMEADGFVINGGSLLPNFEKQAFDITRFYDRFNPSDDPLRREQARNLYGWYPSDSYMDQIDADDRSRFDYYKAMIFAKGTYRAQKAFHRGTRIGTTGVTINEDWAWKTAEYGDTRREVVQFRVAKTDFRDEHQLITFGVPDVPLNNIIEVHWFDRTDLTYEHRWIRPPKTSVDGITRFGAAGATTFEFPVVGELPDVKNYRFYSTLFDTVSGRTVLKHFHFDPRLGQFEPEAMSQVDYVDLIDPGLYDNGPSSQYSHGLTWGVEQVGNLWWDISRRIYVDYRSYLDDYLTTAREWGKPMYLRCELDRLNFTVRARTFDPISGAEIDHGLDERMLISISGAREDDYNVRDMRVVVTSPSTFEYTIDTSPDSPATGNVIVEIGHIDVYEWVESPVAPRGYAAYVADLHYPGAPTGEVYNANDPSWVQVDNIDDLGRVVIKYYFWVRSNNGYNGRKTLSTFDVARRLRYPTSVGLSWFAPIDISNMLIFLDGERVQDGYAIEITVDGRRMDTNVEWVLVSEDDRFDPVPTEMVDKIFDSMAGIDALGFEVPSALLIKSERYGNSFLPQQTVFDDRPAAITAFIAAINTILKYTYLKTIVNIRRQFPIADENTYWKRTDWRAQEYVGQKVFATVATYAIRDERAAAGHYAPGDIIAVELSDRLDPWALTNQKVAEYYLYDGAEFTVVGVDSHTIELHPSLVDDPVRFRRVFYNIYDELDTLVQNRLIFSLAHEMLRQHIICDWFFKTSYVTVHINAGQIAQPHFTPPDEVQAILANLRDVKPFRTKLRNETISYSIDNRENFNIDILELPNKKITLLVDRLSCNLIDDGGWDGAPWDMDRDGWDSPIWRLKDLGRKAWKLLASFTGDSITRVFTAWSSADPSLYGHKVIIYQDDEEITPESISLDYTITITHTHVIVTLSGILGSTFTLEVYQAQGFYQGFEPTLGREFADTLFQPAESDYEHHAARTLNSGVYNPALQMVGCDPNDDLGGRPEERVVAGLTEGVNIFVTTEWTAAYAGWDTTPWDSTGWDLPPTSVGSRLFIVPIGERASIPPGIEILPTSEDLIKATNRFLIGSNHYYTVAQVYRRAIGSNDWVLQERGLHYQLVAPFTHIVEYLIPQTNLYVADGASFSYETIGSQNGIAKVVVDDILQTANEDYIVADGVVTFVQPPATMTNFYALPAGKAYIGDGGKTHFRAAPVSESLNEGSIFAFSNSIHREEISVDDDMVSFDEAPVAESKVVVFNFGGPDALFDTHTFTTDGVATEYLIGNNANKKKTFVFVDGEYQIYGVDYDIFVNGTITFLAPVPLGHTLVIRDGAVGHPLDGEHLVILGNGTNTEVLSISDADPARMLVFVGSTLMNGFGPEGTPDYRILHGAVDRLIWTGTPPTIASEISIRFFRNVLLDSATTIRVFPRLGAIVEVTPAPYADTGDEIRFIYNDWYVTPPGGYVVLSAPGNFDIIRGLLRLNEDPEADQTITINYTKPRPADNPKSILTELDLIVDDLLEDHTVYQDGFDETAYDGMLVVDTTTKRIYEYQAGNWTDVGAVPISQIFFVKRKSEIYEYTGSAFIRSFRAGDLNYATPPQVRFPASGIGFTGGLYALGQTENAYVEFPTSYWIMHPVGTPILVYTAGGGMTTEATALSSLTKSFVGSSGLTIGGSAITS